MTTIKEAFDMLVLNTRQPGATKTSSAAAILNLQAALEDTSQKVPEDILSGTNDEEKRIVLNSLCAIMTFSI